NVCYTQASMSEICKKSCRDRNQYDIPTGQRPSKEGDKAYHRQASVDSGGPQQWEHPL
ncbi:hypothetical protein NDU88_007026, partial [Pleurodeles waltl]